MLRIEAGPRRLRRLPDGIEPEPYTRFTIVPLSPTIGAEIGGVSLADPVDDELFAELDRALLEWKVLFFRDQAVTGEQHRDFARRWGELEKHPFLPEGEVPEIARFDRGEQNQGYENIWHTDVSWREIPSMGSVLRSISVPQVGGDTLFADMACAYDGLPDDVKARIDGLTAVHDWVHSFGLGMDATRIEEMRRDFPPVEHPVVRTHPRNGRKILYVNEIFVSHIVGLEPAESDALLAYLSSRARIPEYQCRFRWSADAIAFWDNRVTQHYAVSDYAPQRRVMERATIIGDRPF